MRHWLEPITVLPVAGTRMLTTNVFFKLYSSPDFYLCEFGISLKDAVCVSSKIFPIFQYVSIYILYIYIYCIYIYFFQCYFSDFNASRMAPWAFCCTAHQWWAFAAKKLRIRDGTPLRCFLGIVMWAVVDFRIFHDISWYFMIFHDVLKYFDNMTYLTFSSDMFWFVQVGGRSDRWDQRKTCLSIWRIPGALRRSSSPGGDRNSCCFIVTRETRETTRENNKRNQVQKNTCRTLRKLFKHCFMS